jgi:hypothetical protein
MAMNYGVTPFDVDGVWLPSAGEDTGTVTVSLVGSVLGGVDVVIICAVMIGSLGVGANAVVVVAVEDKGGSDRGGRCCNPFPRERYACSSF